MESKYVPKPLDTNDIELPDGLDTLTEALARHVHDTWAQGRLREGWRHGSALDGRLMTHPSLVDYDELPESEKDYDRQTAEATLKFVVASGFEIKKREL